MAKPKQSKPSAKDVPAKSISDVVNSRSPLSPQEWDQLKRTRSHSEDEKQLAERELERSAAKKHMTEGSTEVERHHSATGTYTAAMWVHDQSARSEQQRRISKKGRSAAIKHLRRIIQTHPGESSSDYWMRMLDEEIDGKRVREFHEVNEQWYEGRPEDTSLDHTRALCWGPDMPQLSKSAIRLANGWRWTSFRTAVSRITKN